MDGKWMWRVFVIGGEMLTDWENIVGIGNEAYDWWEGVKVRKEYFWNNGEVAEWSEKEPTARVVMNWCGVDVDS